MVGCSEPVPGNDQEAEGIPGRDTAPTEDECHEPARVDLSGADLAAVTPTGVPTWSIAELTAYKADNPLVVTSGTVLAFAGLCFRILESTAAADGQEETEATFIAIERDGSYFSVATPDGDTESNVDFQQLRSRDPRDSTAELIQLGPDERRDLSVYGHFIDGQEVLIAIRRHGVPAATGA